MATHGHADIAALFRAKLKAFAGAVSIRWEGSDFIPKPDKPYLDQSFLPAETQTPTIGADGPVRAAGIFQVLVCYPTGRGSGEAERYADSLIEGFARGTTLLGSNFRVTIFNAWRSPILSDGAWIRIPVSVRYLSDIF